MDLHSARAYTNICRSAISELSLIKHTDITFEFIPSITYVKVTPIYTHTPWGSLVIHLGL